MSILENQNSTVKLVQLNVNLSSPAPSNKEHAGRLKWVPFAEPVPDWLEAKQKWGDWWYFHIYFIGLMYFLVGLFVAANILFLAMSKKLPQKPYYISLNAMVFIFSVERGIFMFVDAYNIHGTLPPAVAYLFLSIGLPCMTSAFYLIFAAWFKATKMQVTHRVHKTSTMVIIITSHFTLSIFFDLVAGFNVHTVILLIICQVCFIIMALLLAGAYFYLYHRIYITTVGTKLSLSMMQSSPDRAIQELHANDSCVPDEPTTNISPTSQESGESGNSGDAMVSRVVDKNSTKQNNKNINNSYIGKSPAIRRISSIPEATVPLGARLILASAILLVIIACLYLAGIFFCYTVHMVVVFHPEPWSFWGYEFAVRLCELALCWIISIAATGPIIRHLLKQNEFPSRVSRAELVNSVSDTGAKAPKNFLTFFLPKV